jgi:hypothetical protein
MRVQNFENVVNTKMENWLTGFCPAKPRPPMSWGTGALTAPGCAYRALAAFAAAAICAASMTARAPAAFAAAFAAAAICAASM